MQEKATKLYVRVNATQPASGVALRFLIQEGKMFVEMQIGHWNKSLIICRIGKILL